MDTSRPAPLYRKKTVAEQLEEIKLLQMRGMRDWNITKDVAEFYKVKTEFNPDTGMAKCHYYPYEGGKAYKVRTLPKDFVWVGTSEDLFGRELFSGGGKRLIICEGEKDTLAMAKVSYDRYKKFYPVVGLSSSAMTKSVLKHRDWVRSFEEVVILTDEDEAGYKARDELVRIIGLDKAKITKLPQNDVHEVFENLGPEAVLSAVFDARAVVPSGIISTADLWQQVVEYNNLPSVPYPVCLQGINKKAKGARLGEIALFVSGTSCGKSTLMREICLEFSKLETRVGVVSLEEAPAETARKLAAMELRRNPANEEISLEDLKPGFDAVFGQEKFIVLDHQGSLKDESILDKLEYMALSGCQYIIIDHITILVSEGAGDLQGNEAIDKVMNDLLRFVKRHNVWVGLVSHLRKAPSGGKSFEQGIMPNLDDIKGSGSIKQVSFDIFAFARDLTESDEIKRNTIKMSVLKCRYTGLTGPVEGSYYHFPEGRFRTLDNIPISVPDRNLAEKQPIKVEVNVNEEDAPF